MSWVWAKSTGGIAAAYRCGSESNAGDVLMGLRYQSRRCDLWSGTAVFQSMLVCIAVLSSISGYFLEPGVELQCPRNTNCSFSGHGWKVPKKSLGTVDNTAVTLCPVCSQKELVGKAW